MWPFDQFIKEWPAIVAAPTIYGFLVLAAFAIAFAVVNIFNKREKDILKADNALKDAINKQLKEETERMSKEITSLKKTPDPPAFNHAVYAGPNVFQTLVEIEEKKTTRFTGPPSAWSPAQINKFAEFDRLRDAGAVKIQIYGMPQQHTVVTSTASASEMIAFANKVTGKKS